MCPLNFYSGRIKSQNIIEKIGLRSFKKKKKTKLPSDVKQLEGEGMKCSLQYTFQLFGYMLIVSIYKKEIFFFLSIIH